MVRHCVCHVRPATWSPDMALHRHVHLPSRDGDCHRRSARTRAPARAPHAAGARGIERAGATCAHLAPRLRGRKRARPCGVTTGGTWGRPRTSSGQTGELAQHPGVGVAKAAAIAAAFQLALRTSDQPESRVLRSAEDVAGLVWRELACLRRERLVVLVCDAGNRVRRSLVIAEGSIDRSSFPVREILNAVLLHDGRAFAVAHNHPSGNPTPSETDCRATTELAEAAKVVGLRFLDHVIAAGEAWSSVPTQRLQRLR